jgi:hypothetical protein
MRVQARLACAWREEPDLGNLVSGAAARGPTMLTAGWREAVAARQ